MQIMYKNFYLISLLMSLLFSTYTISALPTNQLRTPYGFEVNVYAEVPGARQMTLGDEGIVYVGTNEDRVYAVVPNKEHSKASRVVTVATDLNGPNGVAYHNGALYVAEIQRIIRYDNINSALNRGEKITPKVVYDGFLNNRHHGYRYIKFGPDSLLYVGLGMPCNICLPANPTLGTISRLKEDGSHFEVFATGIRNSMGFAWDPSSQHLWFTDNGADWLGENMPPDELNYAPNINMHFGFPFFHATYPDTTYFKDRNQNTHYIPPVQLLGPHVAALGMIFYTGSMFPDKYKQQILIAEHGSWNRILKLGYRISIVTREGNKTKEYKPFITGWLQGQKAWGRPVDLLVLPNGSLLISDDYAGVLYRVTYSQKKPELHRQ